MRFLSDFEKSSVAFGLGMSTVVLTVAIKTDWDSGAILLTVGIPLIAYGFWAFYDLRQERARRVRANFDGVIQQRKAQANKITKEKLEIIFGDNPNENPLAYIPAPHRGERRVLLPRDHEVTKQRILQGRGEFLGPDEEVDVRDQWHD